MLAAACSGLLLALPAAAQDTGTAPAFDRPQGISPAAVLDFAPELGADWGAMSLDEFARLMGRRVIRPEPRPDGFDAAVNYLPRARPRPDRLGAPPAGPPQAAPAETATVQARAEAEAARLADRHGLTPTSGSPSAPTPAPVAALQPAPVEPAAAASPPQPEPRPEALPAAATQQAAVAPVPAGEMVAAATPAPVRPAPAPAAAQTLPPPLASVPTAASPDLPAEPLPVLHTTGFRQATYPADRATREDIFIAAEGEAKIAAAMDVAQLLIAHMLLPEARDFHERAQGLGVQLYPELHRRWRVQATMLEVLQRRPLSQAMPEGWRDASLWAIAGKAPPGQIAGPISLAEAIAALQHQSEPVVARLLPELFDAALAAGDLRSADSLLRGAREATRLIDEPIYPLMMGRLALAYDMPEQAFDYFAKAADGRDISAQRARIAMADLAIARRDVRLLPALAEILREGVNQWRHGQEGLILRARLAQVAEDLGDIPLALDIMGRIRTDHPGTAEAVLAHERGALALAAFAMAVDAGEIGLETYLQSLRHVESFYRLDPVWPIARSALARAWSRAGLHVAAASEYAALQNDLKRVGAPVPPEAQSAAIPVEEAEAWLQAGETSRAQLALAREGLPKFNELATRYTVAALQAGATGAVAAAASALSEPQDLRQLARAARQTGQPGAALAAYRGLYLRGRLAESPAETLDAALIAHDLGESSFAGASLTDLRATALGQAGAVTPPLGAALLEPMPSLSPLSQTLADSMLSRSGAAIEAVQALLARPLLAPDQIAAWAAERGSLSDGQPPQSTPRVE